MVQESDVSMAMGPDDLEDLTVPDAKVLDATVMAPVVIRLLKACYHLTGDFHLKVCFRQMDDCHLKVCFHL